MKRFVQVLFLAAVLSMGLQAATLQFSATLLGSNENPANASAGSGTALVTYDDVLRTLVVDVSFSGLTGTTTAAHIHCCTDFPNNVGVATYPVTFPAFPLGVTSGDYVGSWDLDDASSFNGTFIANFGGGSLALAQAALLDGFLAGRSYLNVHTSAFPGGEIRGFLAPVPEPSAVWLLAGACALLAGLRRRRA